MSSGSSAAERHYGYKHLNISKAGLHSDIASCESEPIHIPGFIQPHGALLALDPTTLAVTHASANCEPVLGVRPDELFGKTPEGLLGNEHATALAAALGDPSFKTGFSSVAVGPASEAMECLFSRFKDAVLIELQPSKDAHTLDLLDISLSLQAPLSRMERTSTVEELALFVAKEIRAISGFDRVMVYRFDEDWHGVVLAEDVSERFPVAYLGMHFPAGDIPAQARDLYLLNTLRLIPDTNYAPVPIVAAARDGAPLDLSRSELRSVSPIHIEYLHNIGVRATLTISIIVRGKLWGLVACHHVSPRRIDHAVRSTCDFFAQMLALKLSARIDHAALARRLEASESLARFFAGLEPTRSLSDALCGSWPELLPIFAADALYVRTAEGSVVYGSTLTASDIQSTIDRLAERAEDGIASCASLVTIDPAAERFAAEVSGAIYIELSASDGRCLVLLRREQRASVTWAGDPNKPAMLIPGKRRLSPRASFAAWEEITHGESGRWSEGDLENARSLRDQLLHWQHAREEVRLLVHYDALTELPNRRLLDEVLRRSLIEADAAGDNVGVLFIDVDRFKRFNDRLGHAAGDRVLRYVAARISRAVRECDVVGRLGGDEFVVVMPRLSDPAAAEAVAQRLQNDICQPMPGFDGPDLRVTLSIGTSVYPFDGDTSEALLTRADAAMYHVKEHGRSAWRSHQAAQNAPASRPAERAESIAQALDNGEIVAYFQPIIDVASGRIAAFEALARWNHPVSGVIGPAAFIEIAEETGLIVRLGEAMLDASCRQVSRWRRNGASRIRAAVNVSPRQLRDFRFAGTVRRVLERYDLPPDAIELEITEGMMVGDTSQSIDALRELARTGVRIAIDDFGTGYSSFNYLRKLPVHSLKIDQSFVAELSVPKSRESGTAIIRAIISVAKSLGLEVIGEGVETAAQLDVLRALGCDFAQGYHIGRPAPPADTVANESAHDPLTGSARR